MPKCPGMSIEPVMVTDTLEQSPEDHEVGAQRHRGVARDAARAAGVPSQESGADVTRGGVLVGGRRVEVRTSETQRDA